MARPSNFEQAANVPIRVRVTHFQYKDLKQVAADNHTDVSGVIRDAVNAYVADYRDNNPVFRRSKP